MHVLGRRWRAVRAIAPVNDCNRRPGLYNYSYRRPDRSHNNQCCGDSRFPHLPVAVRLPSCGSAVGSFRLPGGRHLVKLTCLLHRCTHPTMHPTLSTHPAPSCAQVGNQYTLEQQVTAAAAQETNRLISSSRSIGRPTRIMPITAPAQHQHPYQHSSQAATLQTPKQQSSNS